MRKQIIFITFLVLSFTTAQQVQAQQGEFKINPGLELGLPIGDFGDVANLGFGATVKGLYGVSDAGQVELTVGYLTFSGKDDWGNVDVIPIMAGYRHSFDGLYGEGQLGFASVKTKVDLGMLGELSSSSTEFSWAIGAGYMFDDFDVSLRYQSIEASNGSDEDSSGSSSWGWLGLRIGYSFDL